MNADTTGGEEPTSPPSRWWQRLIRVETAVEVGVAATAAAMIFVLVLVQAGQRYLPIDGWVWTGELARYGLVWVTFTAAGVLVTRDGHIALQIVDQLPNERVVRLIHVVALVVVAACGAGYAVACWSLLQESGNATTPAMGMPVTWIYVLPLLGFVSTAVRATVAAVQVARNGVPQQREPESLAIDVNRPPDARTRS